LMRAISSSLMRLVVAVWTSGNWARDSARDPGAARPLVPRPLRAALLAGLYPGYSRRAPRKTAAALTRANHRQQHVFRRAS